jgi:iron transport multicopper oxidase
MYLLVHCHIEWHVEAGKTVSFIEAPELLQKMNIKLPADHIRACSLQNIPIQGNCEGNTVNPTNTTACPSQEMAVNLGAFVALPPSPPSHPSPVSPPSGHASGLSSGLPSGFPSQGRAGSLF